jgi:membrane fusion protein (multidrug efflux system)
MIPKDTDRNGSPGGSSKWWQKKRVLIPLLIFILAAIAVTYYWYTYVRGFDSTDDAYIDADNMTISSKILGRITELGADEGDTVTEDQSLVRLDDSDLKAQENQAQANLEFARKNTALAQVNLDKAQSDFSRADEQFKGNAITREQYDHARQAVQTARAQSDASEAQIVSAQAQLGVVETQLQNTEIRAPFRGVVAKKWLLPGDVVQAAQPILTLYSLEDSWITAYFEETKIQSIHLGDPVEIVIDAYPEHKFEGKVIQIGSTAASQFSLIPPNNASGNFTKVTQRIPIKIGLNIHNPDDINMPLRAGMSVEVKINIRGK